MKFLEAILVVPASKRLPIPNYQSQNHEVSYAVQGLVQPSKHLPIANQHPKLSAKHIQLFVLNFI
jgi:hypothetical protein